MSEHLKGENWYTNLNHFWRQVNVKRPAFQIGNNHPTMLSESRSTNRSGHLAGVHLWRPKGKQSHKSEKSSLLSPQEKYGKWNIPWHCRHLAGHLILLLKAAACYCPLLLCHGLWALHLPDLPVLSACLQSSPSCSCSCLHHHDSDCRRKEKKKSKNYIFCIAQRPTQSVLLVKETLLTPALELVFVRQSVMWLAECSLGDLEQNQKLNHQ